MKKDIIFAPMMLLVGILLFMLRATGMTAHIIISVLGIIVLAAYTATTKKEWKIPALEIIMRACYGIALISGGIILKVSYIPAVAVAHKVSAAVFVVLFIVLFVHKTFVKKA